MQPVKARKACSGNRGHENGLPCRCFSIRMSPARERVGDLPIALTLVGRTWARIPPRLRREAASGRGVCGAQAVVPGASSPGSRDRVRVTGRIGVAEVKGWLFVPGAIVLAAVYFCICCIPLHPAYHFVHAVPSWLPPLRNIPYGT